MGEERMCELCYIDAKQKEPGARSTEQAETQAEAVLCCQPVERLWNIKQ